MIQLILFFNQNGTVTPLWEYGLLGGLLAIAFMAIRHLYVEASKKNAEYTERIISMQEKHNEDLLDMMAKQISSNASLKEKIQHISITDKEIMKSFIATEHKELITAINELKNAK